jgi:hypothetical protein
VIGVVRGGAQQSGAHKFSRKTTRVEKWYSYHCTILWNNIMIPDEDDVAVKDKASVVATEDSPIEEGQQDVIQNHSTDTYEKEDHREPLTTTHIRNLIFCLLAWGCTVASLSIGTRDKRIEM